MSSFLETLPGSPENVDTQLSFVHDDSIPGFLGFEPVVLYDKYSLSDNPVDILSSKNIFIETYLPIEYFLKVTEQEYSII